MKKKIVVAGYVSLDITPVFPDETEKTELSKKFEPGKLITVGAASVTTGGCVANTGLALKTLGVDTELIGKVGTDHFGKILNGLLAEYGAEGMTVDDSAGTCYTVVIAVPGFDRMFLQHSGANDIFVNADISEKSLEEATILHFGYPTHMRSMYINEGEELLTLMKRARAKGVVTSLDFALMDPASEAIKADWKLILKRVLPLVDFFLPSFEEICVILNRDNYNRLEAVGGDMVEHISIEEDVRPLADELIALGAKVVMIKCGTAGIYYKTADESALRPLCESLELETSAWANREGHQPCFRAEKVLSAVAAGDTCIAAFLASILEGNGLEKSVALAAAEGACSVTTFDAVSGLKSLEELETMINR